MGKIRVTIRIDEYLKKQSEKVLDELGLNIPAAVEIYLQAIAVEKKLPFELTYANTNPFFSEKHQFKTLKEVEAYIGLKPVCDDEE